MRLSLVVLYPVAAAILSAASAFAQQVTIERDSELRAEAKPDAAVVAKVSKGTTGEVTAKSGAWVNVKTPEAAGWMFSFNVRFTSAQPAGQARSGEGGAGIGNPLAPRRTPAVTGTIGIRGLDEEELKGATNNPEQMKLLQQSGTTKESAAESARKDGLAPVKIPLPGERSK
jgi:uncharacterized protein YgiM (DUF1202 family)